MKVLIIGNGAREHAFAWKVSCSPQVTELFVAPGNAGTALEPKTRNIAIEPHDLDALTAFAKTENIDLTLVGPELPLSLGITDRFLALGLKCLGPKQQAARLESSKAYAKKFMQKYQIPTASFAEFTDPKQAMAYIEKHAYPLVIKADGLAAGKGVVIAHDPETAQKAIQMLLIDYTPLTPTLTLPPCGEGKEEVGEAGAKIIIESFITGREVSFIVLTDGKTCIPFATSQDYKTRDDNHQGPNTGGMGACSPAPHMTSMLQDQILEDIITPTLRGMAAEGTPYVGFLYAGLMITPEGKPWVLEFNCRFGDPETQVILMRLRSDFALLCLRAAEGSLGTPTLEWDPRLALCVVLAAKGYPDHYARGEIISGLPESLPQHCKIFHAGTVATSSHLKTAGGRVFSITTLAESIDEARRCVYPIAEAIHWGEGVHYRKDIGRSLIP